MNWFTDTLKTVRDAGMETLEGVGGVVRDELVRAVSLDGAQPESYNQPETGDNGKGQTVVQAQPTGVVQSTRAGLPAWALPVSLGVAGLTAAVVVVGLIVGRRAG